MVCSFFYSALGLCSGVSLPQLVKETTGFRDLCICYKVNTAITTTSIILQVFHNLTGRAINPVVLTGEVLDEDQTSLNTFGKHPVAYMFLLLYKHYLAVYMNDFQEAQEISIMIQESDMGNIYPFLVSLFEFFDGLVASRLARSSKPQHKRANQLLLKLRLYAKHCPQNFQGKVWLVEAELAASSGGIDDALAMYRSSIDWARKQGLVHDEALAYERAGYSLHDVGRKEEAEEFFIHARTRYSSWGAKVKVNQLSSFFI